MTSRPEGLYTVAAQKTAARAHREALFSNPFSIGASQGILSRPPAGVAFLRCYKGNDDDVPGCIVCGRL